MKIPSKISPCPITEAIMEVRFESNFDEGVVFGLIYSLIQEDFEKPIQLPILELPASLRKSDLTLKYLPHYRAKSKVDKNLLVQIGPNVFSIVITKDYPGWDEFLNKIEKGLTKLEDSKVVSKVVRFALRYINFFPTNVLKQSNLSIRLNEIELLENNTNIILEIPDGDFKNKLTLNNNAFKKEEDAVIRGSIIDIDTMIELEMPDFFIKQKKLLDTCHKAEKKLFSSLLSEEYVKTLKEVVYD